MLPVKHKVPLGTVASLFALFVATQSCAQSSAQVYGLIDLSAAQLQAAGAAKVKQLASGSMTTNFLGFRGREDLGDGLAAYFVLESYVRPDTGESGRFGGDPFFARNAYLGLSSPSWGSIELGRNTTPLFVTTLRFNAFGPSIGFSPSMRHWVSGAAGIIIGDTSWNDSIRYNSPKFANMSFSVMTNAGEGKATSVGSNATAQVLFDQGSLSAAVVWQSVKNATSTLPTGFDHQDAWQANVSYDFSVVKVFGQYGRVQQRAAADRLTKLTDMGVKIPVGLGAILVGYGQASNSGAATNVRKTMSLGYDYSLSKRTDIYAVYMNDKNSNVANGNSFAVGMRHTF